MASSNAQPPSSMLKPPFHIVLLNPEIPNNTGNIGRTAVATGCVLHLIHPLGFSLDEKARRRAGLDYWTHLDCREHESWDAFLEAESPQRLGLFTTMADRPQWEADFKRGDYLLFGRETSGTPQSIHDAVIERWGEGHRITQPMRAEARSLNLATAVCAGVYEGLRQLDCSMG